MSDWQNIDYVLLQLNQQASALEKEKLREQLIFFVNYLLLNDFNKLVQVLYRVDVSEEKLKTLLREQPQSDAAELITDLLIQRQAEKNSSRQSSGSVQDIADEDLW